MKKVSKKGTKKKSFLKVWLGLLGLAAVTLGVFTTQSLLSQKSASENAVLGATTTPSVHFAARAGTYSYIDANSGKQFNLSLPGPTSHCINKNAQRDLTLYYYSSGKVGALQAIVYINGAQQRVSDNYLVGQHGHVYIVFNDGTVPATYKVLLKEVSTSAGSVGVNTTYSGTYGSCNPSAKVTVKSAHLSY